MSKCYLDELRKTLKDGDYKKLEKIEAVVVHKFILDSALLCEPRYIYML